MIIHFAKSVLFLLLSCNALHCRADPIQGSAQVTIKAHEHHIQFVTFSEDGSMLATGGYDGTVLLWNVKQKKIIHSLIGHKSNATSGVFSHDGKQLATGSWDASIIIWDTKTGKKLKTLKNSDSNIQSLSYGDDSAIIFSAHGGTTITKWDCDRGETIDSKSIKYKQGINGILYSSPNKLIITSCNYDGMICVWKESEKLPKKIKAHDSSIYGIACSNDGSLIASAGEDLAPKLWDLSGKGRNIVLDDDVFVYGLSFNYDTTLLATAVAIKDSKKRISIWNLKERKEYLSLNHEHLITCLAFCKKSNCLAAGTSKGELVLYDIKK